MEEKNHCFQLCTKDVTSIRMRFWIFRNFRTGLYTASSPHISFLSSLYPVSSPETIPFWRQQCSITWLPCWGVCTKKEVRTIESGSFFLIFEKSAVVRCPPEGGLNPDLIHCPRNECPSPLPCAFHRNHKLSIWEASVILVVQATRTSFSHGNQWPRQFFARIHSVSIAYSTTWVFFNIVRVLSSSRMTAPACTLAKLKARTEKAVKRKPLWLQALDV